MNTRVRPTKPNCNAWALKPKQKSYSTKKLNSKR